MDTNAVQPMGVQFVQLSAVGQGLHQAAAANQTRLVYIPMGQTVQPDRRAGCQGPVPERPARVHDGGVSGRLKYRGRRRAAGCRRPTQRQEAESEQIRLETLYFWN